VVGCRYAYGDGCGSGLIPNHLADPASILGSTLSIIVDYGVPVFFCCDRQIALAFTEKYLRRVHRKITCENSKAEKEDS